MNIFSLKFLHVLPGVGGSATYIEETVHLAHSELGSWNYGDCGQNNTRMQNRLVRQINLYCMKP